MIPLLLVVGGTVLILALLAIAVWIWAYFRRAPESGKQTIEVDGEERVYYIRWPNRLGVDHPLLLAFHGGLGSAEFFQKQTRFFESGPLRNYVVVYPEAPEGWIDARPERGGSPKDLVFVDRLLDHLLLYPEIDPRRVFAVGSSNGGLFIFRLATDQPHQRFAGFATALAQMPVEAMNQVGEGPPVPILLAHGSRDFLMPFQGGELVKSKNVGKGGTVISARENLAFWVHRNRASPRPQHRTIGRPPRLIEVLDFPPLPGGAPVRYLEIQNWGHRWPRWDASPEEGIEAYDFADTMYQFFAELVLPLERLDAPEAVMAEAS